mgnify:CR=1 FL=1
MFCNFPCIYVCRGNGLQLTLSQSLLEKISKSQIEFKNIKITDYGSGISFNGFEFSVLSILYHLDKHSRKRMLDNEINCDRTFGGCCRRYRLNLKLSYKDLNITENKLTAIENNTLSTYCFKTKIADELGLSVKQLMTY